MSNAIKIQLFDKFRIIFHRQQKNRFSFFNPLQAMRWAKKISINSCEYRWIWLIRQERCRQIIINRCWLSSSTITRRCKCDKRILSETKPHQLILMSTTMRCWHFHHYQCCCSHFGRLHSPSMSKRASGD